LRPGLEQARLAGLDLAVDAGERRRGGGALGLGAVERDALVAIVERDQELAGLDLLVAGHRDIGDVGRELGRDRRHLRTDISVVRRDDEAAVAPPIDAVIQAAAERSAGKQCQPSLRAMPRRVSGAGASAFAKSARRSGGPEAAELSFRDGIDELQRSRRGSAAGACCAL